jgi:hypothetical protein
MVRGGNVQVSFFIIACFREVSAVMRPALQVSQRLVAHKRGERRPFR